MHQGGPAPPHAGGVNGLPSAKSTGLKVNFMSRYTSSSDLALCTDDAGLVSDVTIRRLKSLRQTYVSSPSYPQHYGPRYLTSGSALL